MHQQPYVQNTTPYKAGVGAVNIQIYNPSVSPVSSGASNGYIPNGANYGNYLPNSYVPPMQNTTSYPQGNLAYASPMQNAEGYSNGNLANAQGVRSNIANNPAHYNNVGNYSNGSPSYVQNAENNYYGMPSNPYGPPVGTMATNPNGQSQTQHQSQTQSGVPKAPVAKESPIAKKPVKPVTSKTQEEAPPPPLKNAYIQNLEATLSSQNKEKRFNAANLVVSEFRVHKSRQQDPQLTPLLNKILKDPYQGVRLLGLSVIQSGHAKGDDETISILKDMQGSKKVYNRDALLASKILLEMSGDKLQPKYAQKKPVKPVAPQTVPQGHKLNVVSS